MSSPRIPLIYGTAAFGTPPGPHIGRISDPSQAQQMIDLAVKELGIKELDSARGYGAGATEKTLGSLDLHGASVDTKCMPRAPGDHSPEKIRQAVETSAEMLKPHKIRIFYLHAPDRTVPFGDTVAEVDKLHKKGLFEAFGLSNFNAYEVAEVHAICKERGYVLPTVYQGPYSLLARTNEDELFPALRRLGMRFVAYSTLAGGLLKGDPKRPGGRYDMKSFFAPQQTKMYQMGKQNEGLQLIKAAADKNGISIGEVAIRWIQHHSKLTPSDGVIIGATSLEQLKENHEDALKGPLPDEVLDAIQKSWVVMKGTAIPYAAGWGVSAA